LRRKEELSKKLELLLTMQKLKLRIKEELRRLRDLEPKLKPEWNKSEPKFKLEWLLSKQRERLRFKLTSKSKKEFELKEKLNLSR